MWILSLFAALLFDQAFRGRDIIKAAFFLPVLPPIVVVAVIWRVLLHPNGVMTWLIGGRWGMTEIRWLADAVLAPLSMIAVHDWAAIPFFMVIWLAGLAGIPAEQREAAALDGAGPVRTFWYIELPHLRATAVLVAALSSINAFQAFALQYVLPTDPGGPANSTLVLGLLVLKYGFQYFRMGDAAAVSMVMFAMILSRHDRAAAVQPPCVSAPSAVLIAAVAAAIFAFPIWFMVSSAFKAEAEVQAIPLHFFPHNFQGLAQFRQAAEIAPLWRYFLNSWIYAASACRHHGVLRRAGRIWLREIPVSWADAAVRGRAVHDHGTVPGAGRAAVRRGEVVRLGEQLCGPHHPRDDERVRRVHDAAIRVGPAGRVDRGGACRWRRRVPHLPAHRAAAAATGAGEPGDHRVHLVVGEFPVAAGHRAGQGPQRAVGRHDQLQPAVSARTDVGGGHGCLDRRHAANCRTVRVLPAVFREGADGGGGEGIARAGTENHQVIVSHANRFIFFHNPKCAGTSFRDTLKSHHDDSFNFWGIFNAPYFKNNIDHTHLRLWELQAQFPRIFACAESYNSVIFVRNPSARFLSAVNEHMKKFQPQMNLTSMTPQQRAAVVEAFVRQVLTVARITTDWRFIHFSPQIWYLRLGDRVIPRHVIPMGSDDAFMREALSAARDAACRCRATTPRRST